MTRYTTGAFDIVESSALPTKTSDAPSVAHLRPGEHPNAWLHGLTSGFRGIRAGVPQHGVFLIGRDGETCQLKIDEVTVSKQHASLELIGGRYFLTDLGSTNGTILNGAPLPRHQPAPVDNGDVIALAGVVALRFVAVSFHGYHSAFISYGRPDDAFASLLFDRLSVHGVRAFYFPETAIPGQTIERVLYEAVTNHDRLVVVCSEKSLSRVGVRTEIQHAFGIAAERAFFGGIVPIWLDDYIETSEDELCRRLRKLAYVDFMRAEAEPGFQAAFARLLDALRRDMPADASR
jgi:hypothetical protein